MTPYTTRVTVSSMQNFPTDALLLAIVSAVFLAGAIVAAILNRPAETANGLAYGAVIAFFGSVFFLVLA